VAELPRQLTIERGLGKYRLADHYAVLGVPLTAEPEQIRSRFLTIAKALHPDTFQGTDRERLFATTLFARMISPAYQTLTNDRMRSEYLATVKLLIQSLKKKDEKIEVKSEAAIKFQKDFHPTFYPGAVESASRNQYQNIDKVLDIIGDLSEINLIYLMSQETTVAPATPEPVVVSSDPSNKIRRELQMAELFIGKKQWSDALKELKAAEKKTTESSTLYQLLGVVYLNQGALTTARTSLQKALKLDPKNEEAKKTLAEVEKKMSQPKKEEKKGWFGFGRK
jgi:curved DNA-binding protein CbpA